MVGGREEPAGENLSVHMHSHMSLQVLSVKEKTWQGAFEQAGRCRKTLRKGMPPWEAKPRWCDCARSRHPQTAPFCPAPFPPSIPRPSATEDVVPLAAATPRHKASLLQSTRRWEDKVVPNGKRPKLTYFYHLSFKKI